MRIGGTMISVILTQNTTPIFKYIVWILGKIMEGIFNVLDLAGIPNIGLAIIFFTIFVNVCMLPLTYKQQKFSKLSMKMQPEIKAVQKKYEGKKDQDSMMKQNAEIQAVYAKYGTSPTGSCLYLLIQMPILFALYRVIYKFPAYVTKIGDTFRVLANEIIKVDNAAFLKDSGVSSIASVVSAYGKTMTDDNLQNGIVDVLYMLTKTDLNTVADHYGLSDLTFGGSLILSKFSAAGDLIQRGLIDTYRNFLGLNIGDNPWSIMKSAFAAGSYLLVIGAVLIPVLSGFTQWLSIKLAPQQDSNAGNSGDPQQDSMAQSMKTMNNLMPLMSVWFCFTLPAGMGIYWIANAVVRIVIQIIMNKKIDSIDFQELITKNSGKSAKKMEKMREAQERMTAYANVKTKNIQSKASYSNPATDDASSSSVYFGASSGSGSSSGSTSGSTGSSGKKSMLDKANMVRDFNERNSK